MAELDAAAVKNLSLKQTMSPTGQEEGHDSGVDETTQSQTRRAAPSFGKNITSLQSEETKTHSVSPKIPKREVSVEPSSDSDDETSSSSSKSGSEISLVDSVSESKSASGENGKKSSKKDKKGKKSKKSFFSNLFSKSPKSSPKRLHGSHGSKLDVPTDVEAEEFDIGKPPHKSPKIGKKSKAANTMEALEHFAKKHVRRNKSPVKDLDSDDTEKCGTLTRIAKKHASKPTAEGETEKSETSTVGSKKDDFGYISSSPADMSASSSRSVDPADKNAKESLSDVEKFATPLNLGEKVTESLLTTKAVPYVDESVKEDIPHPETAPRSVFSILADDKVSIKKSENVTKVENPQASDTQNLSTPSIIRKNTTPKDQPMQINSSMAKKSENGRKNTHVEFSTNISVDEDSYTESYPSRSDGDDHKSRPKSKASDEKAVNGARSSSKSKVRITSDLPKSMSTSEPSVDKLKRSTSPYQRPKSCSDNRFEITKVEYECTTSSADVTLQLEVKEENGECASPDKGGRVTPKRRQPRSVDPSPMNKGFTTRGATSVERKKLPMNKIEVGKTASPNLKQVKSKIGSLQNTTHRPGGGNFRVESKKIDFSKTSSRIAAKNDEYKPGGGEKKIESKKLQWNAQSKIGSLENKSHKAGGGDKKIESKKLEFGKNVQSKVGSKDNIKHKAGGGEVQIQSQKLNFKTSAASKVGSFQNVTHKAGGGEKKIFDDKEYLRQKSNESRSKTPSSVQGSEEGESRPESADEINPEYESGQASTSPHP